MASATSAGIPTSPCPGRGRVSSANAGEGTERLPNRDSRSTYPLIIIDGVDLPLRPVPEQQVLSQPLPGELPRRQQQPLEHRLERIEFLGTAPDTFLDLLRR